MPKTKAIYNPIKEPAQYVTEISSTFSIKQHSERRSKDIQLIYDGKISEIELLNSIPNAYLREIDSFGQLNFHGSHNSLISGDNLPALKCLLEDSKIAGNDRGGD